MKNSLKSDCKPREKIGSENVPSYRGTVTKRIKDIASDLEGHLQHTADNLLFYFLALEENLFHIFTLTEFAHYF